MSLNCLTELIISTPPQILGSDALVSEELQQGFDAAEVEVRCTQVPVELHGQRLDKALAQMVPEFSRSYLQQLIEQGDVLVCLLYTSDAADE